MFEEDEATTVGVLKCEESECENDAVYRCTPDADYPVPEDDYLEVLVCSDHLHLGLGYPMSWPGPPAGWRVELVDVIRDFEQPSGLPN